EQASVRGRVARRRGHAATALETDAQDLVSGGRLDARDGEKRRCDPSAARVLCPDKIAHAEVGDPHRPGRRVYRRRIREADRAVRPAGRLARQDVQLTAVVDPELDALALRLCRVGGPGEVGDAVHARWT